MTHVVPNCGQIFPRNNKKKLNTLKEGAEQVKKRTSDYTLVHVQNDHYRVPYLENDP